MAGFKFRRQHTIERFIVDFYCREAKLAIEVDGEHHQNQVEDDAVRDAYLRAQGIRTLRLSNAEVFGDSDAVRAKVLNALLPLSVHGEGAGG